MRPWGWQRRVVLPSVEYLYREVLPSVTSSCTKEGETNKTGLLNSAETNPHRSHTSNGYWSLPPFPGKNWNLVIISSCDSFRITTLQREAPPLLSRSRSFERQSLGRTSLRSARRCPRPDTFAPVAAACEAVITSSLSEMCVESSEWNGKQRQVACGVNLPWHRRRASAQPDPAADPSRLTPQ